MNLEITTSASNRYPTEKQSWRIKTALNKGVNWEFIKALTQKKWYIRLTNKEYWNAHIYTVPIIFYGTYLAARARSPLFFTAANPAIPTGGMVGESKADISSWIPPHYRPKNALIQLSDSMEAIQTIIEKAGMQFPLVLKPVVGCRGLMVEKVNTLEEANEHILRFPTNFLIEEFIDYPVEAAVLYWKNPETGKSGIQSVAGKAFLTVIGDGRQAVECLLKQNPRGILQIERLQKEKPELLKYIPQSGEKVLVEHIGNHCRGTKFLNYNHLITPDMVAAFDKIQADLPGCYVFRLDLKTPSVSDLQAGRNIKILEINGVGSDPAHIYDPNIPFFEIWAAYIRLWKKIYEISTALHRLGVPYMKLKEYKNYIKIQKDMEDLNTWEP
jgi:RimK-like ATP-grasp domain